MILTEEGDKPLDVEVRAESDSLEDADEPGINLADIRNLSVLNASSRSQTAGIALERSGDETGLRLLDLDIARSLREDGKWGEIASETRVIRKMPVIAASAPGTDSATTTAKYRSLSTSSSGFRLKIGGVGIESKVVYEVSETLEINCAAGQAKIGFLRIPLSKITQMWRPPSAAEWFKITRYEPVEDIKHLMAGAAFADLDELLEGATDEPMIVGSGDASFSAEHSRKMDLVMNLELGVKWADDVNELSVSAELKGSLEVTCGYSVPGGSYALYWLAKPAGACLVGQ